MIELEIDSIRVNLRSYQRVVILREKDAGRFLPIWIGATEADAIAYRLQDVSVARPQTHDLLANVIEQLGGKVRSVVVCDMSNDVFYARVNLEQNGRTLEIDARPSDAIALAVRAQVPIYVDEAVLADHGVMLNAEGELAPEDEAKASRATPEELEKLAAFKDFLEELDLDDLGKRG
ncbi:MAG: bifunctional nuclease family protein [Dehalococcoidia bacterium]|nr:bifunctional nuclease family protein [Dehalococcoidia bacterium]